MPEELTLEHEEYQDTGVTTALGQYCRDLFNEYDGSSYRQRKIKEINAGRKRYNNDVPAKTKPFVGCSNKSLGLEAIAVDNLEPRLVNKLMAEDNFIQVKPTGKEDVESVEPVKEFMNWAVNQNMQIKKHMKPVVHDLLMDGTKDVLPIWDEKQVITRIRGQQPVFTDMEGNKVSPPPGMLSAGQPEQVMQALLSMGLQPAGSEEGYQEKSDTKFKVKLQALKIEDCYFPDHNDDWENQPFLRKIYPELGELVDLQKDKVYKNITNRLVRGAVRDTTDDESRKDIQYSDYGQECELIECFVRWKGTWTLATFSPDAGWEEVRKQPLIDVYWHGRKPVHRFVIYPKSNESMGTGVPEKIKMYSKGMDDLYNQMIDAGSVEITPYGFFNSSSTGVSAAQKHKIFPGALIPIPKDSNITFPNVGGRSAMFIQFINLLLTFFERTLSLMDYSAGTRSSTTGQGGDTASGMNMILQEGNIKHNYTGEALQDTFGNVLTDVLSLYAQNMPMTAKMRVFEGNQWLFKDIDVQAIQGKYDISIDVSDASANTMTNRNEKLALMNTLGSAPFMNPVQLAEDVLKAFGIKDTEKRISPAFSMLSQALQQAPELAQQIQQMVTQHMQAKQAQEQEQQIRGQAQANIKRQAIEREVEAPYENQKLVDQSNESYKRKIIGQVVEGIGGFNELEPGQ